MKQLWGESDAKEKNLLLEVLNSVFLFCNNVFFSNFAVI